MPDTFKIPAIAMTLALAFAARLACATESIEFVAEHLPEIAMDNRFATLPLWDGSAVQAGYSRSSSGTLSIEGPMLSFSVARPIGERHRIVGFVFFDDLSLASGVEHRPLEVLFANPPLSLPADAEFSGLDGTARDLGFGAVLTGPAHLRWLPAFEWSLGLIWQRFRLDDYRFDYRITGGPDAGVTGTLDYSSTYTHISPLIGAAWEREHGAWSYAPHFQIAVPLPRRGVAGRITGPGFDLSGNTADNGAGKHFGDPSLTIGLNVTYRPWNFTVDVGSTFTQAVLEPLIHEGVEHNLMLSTYWSF